MATLEKLCINLITENFERFYFAFTVSKNGNLQRSFEFLQRRFSDQLATELHETGKLEEQYFEFLLNDHLTFLDSQWFKSNRYLNSVDDIFNCLPNLTKISLRECTDEILEIIAECYPKLIEIDVSLSSVTDNGVKYLCENNGVIPCPEIKIVFIRFTRITDRGAECLIRNLPSLERIDYLNVPKLLRSIYKENLIKFQKVHYYNLIELDLLPLDNFADYTEVLKICITVCPKLESLACCILDKEQLDLLSETHLKKLHLKYISFEPDISINVDDFLKANGSNLTFLKLRRFIISVPVLARYCPVLKELETHNVNFIDDGDLKPIFPCLIKFSLVTINPSADKSLRLLFSSSPNLETISFRFGTLSLDIKTQLLMWGKNPSAKTIHFRDLYLDVKFLRDIILSCPSLKEMVLNRCTFDDDRTEELVCSLAKTLPNKPRIYFTNYLSTDDEYMHSILRETYRLRYETTGKGLEAYQFFI